MSFTFDFIINPIILFVAVVSGFILGAAVERAKLVRSRSRVQQLETELMQSNQETLEAQRAYVNLESRLTDQSSPVIPMKINGSKENSKEKASK
jgi:hypothetical protein